MALTLALSILPALAFSLDMFQKTGSNYGVNEVLLASVLGSVVFSLFSAQPLVIVGVTGKFSLHWAFRPQRCDD
jgi:boron transporter